MNEQLILNKKKKKLNLNNVILKNSFILIIASIIIKIISLLNRVYLTRLLGNFGIAIYTLILPTIMLFISIGGFSLNNTVTKIVSENNQYSDDMVLRTSRLMAYFSSLITIIIFIFSVKFISYNLLKQPQALGALLYTIIFIPITALNNVYRGFVSGKNKMQSVAIANVLEQISRFFITLILLYAFSSLGVFFSVKLTIIAMCFGELISLLFIIKKAKAYKETNQTNINNNQLFKKIFSLSISTTLTHLLSNITFFLEPIIYTFALSKININNEEILLSYSEMNSFVLPTLTLLSFITFQFSQALLPVFSKNNKNNDTNANQNIMNKALGTMIPISIFIMMFYLFYSEETLLFLYDTNIGSNKIKLLAPFFIVSYLTPIFISYLQATNSYNFILKSSLFISVTRLLIILILGLNSSLYVYALDISIIFTMIITLILYIYKITRTIKIKIPILKTIFLLLISYYINLIVITLDIHFILEILIAFIIYFMFLVFL